MTEYAAQERMASSSRIAPSLSSGSLKLPHFGDCTHDGHPVTHGHALIASTVARRCSDPASYATGEIPAPPGYAS